MSRLGRTSEERASRVLADSFNAAMTAPHTSDGGDGDGPSADSSLAQRQRINAWAQTLRDSEAPEELVQDCVEYLRAAVVDGESAPYSSTKSRGKGAEGRGETSDADGPKSGAPQPVVPNTQLDVDRCTLTRMRKDEHAHWMRWHDTDPFDAVSIVSLRGGTATYPTGALSAGGAVADVFSDAAEERERWLGWASVLREVKTEAAVQWQHRRPRRNTTDTVDTALASLLDYLDVPETRWLLEDTPSSVLMAADMFMKSRAYAVGMGRRASSNSGGDVGGAAQRTTNDMAAVHAYLTHPDRADAVPLRSLLSLTLSSHMSDGNRASSPTS